MITTITRMSRLALLASLGAAVSCASVGCSSVPKDEYAQAIEENAELRDRLRDSPVVESDVTGALQQSALVPGRLSVPNTREHQAVVTG